MARLAGNQSKNVVLEKANAASKLRPVRRSSTLPHWQHKLLLRARRRGSVWIVPQSEQAITILSVRTRIERAGCGDSRDADKVVKSSTVTEIPDLAALDAADPLAPLRECFDLPDGVIYLDGNSLGPLPRATKPRMAQVVAEEWGRDLIGSWESNGWMEMPRRVGEKIAQLIKAAPGSTVACDSTSVNLFKALAAALALRPERRVILTDADDFPTDRYVTRGLVSLLHHQHTVREEKVEEIEKALGSDIAVLSLTHVNYRTGRMHEMTRLTEAAHAVGALVVWDLAHSAGAVPVDMMGCEADFAVGCGYKFLNGGPGAPAFLMVAPKHQDVAMPLTGWMGHADPFAFAADYRPAPQAGRGLVGTPHILSLAALEVGVDLALQADMRLVRQKSVQMTEAFMVLIERVCAGLGFEIASPRDAVQRGSQVSLRHPQAQRLVQNLIVRGVIADYRPPDILRFGITPLYLRYNDIGKAVQTIAEVANRSI